MLKEQNWFFFYSFWSKIYFQKLFIEFIKFGHFLKSFNFWENPLLIYVPFELYHTKKLNFTFLKLNIFVKTIQPLVKTMSKFLNRNVNGLTDDRD